ncbi:hypothetical protein Q3G72_023676 [Acer saccharum]|nr:hypothetical protein Q3G72_023676 [Acer saccharum]
MVETASSTQSDIEELTTEMFKKLDSIESTVDGEQSSVRERRQQLAEYGDIFKKLSQKAASDCRVDFARYQPLWTAVYDKNMKAVEDFINKNLETILDAHIDESGSTIFHLIVQLPATELTEALTEKLVSKVQANSLVEQTNIFRMTALHIAAGVGNTKAVELLVKKNKDLLTKRNFNGRLPLSYAIFSGRYKDTVEYLLSDPEGRIENFADKFPLDSAFILFQLIDANHIDIPAEVEKHILRSENGDIENQTQTSRKAIIFGKLQYMLWNALMSLVPGIKRIQNQKLMHFAGVLVVFRGRGANSLADNLAKLGRAELVIGWSGEIYDAMGLFGVFFLPRYRSMVELAAWFSTNQSHLRSEVPLQGYSNLYPLHGEYILLFKTSISFIDHLQQFYSAVLIACTLVEPPVIELKRNLFGIIEVLQV